MWSLTSEQKQKNMVLNLVLGPKFQTRYSCDGTKLYLVDLFSHTTTTIPNWIWRQLQKWNKSCTTSIMLVNNWRFLTLPKGPPPFLDFKSTSCSSCQSMPVEPLFDRYSAKKTLLQHLATGRPKKTTKIRPSINIQTLEFLNKFN